MSENSNSALERKHAEQRYQLQVKRDLTRNFVVHLGHGMLGQTGFRLLMAPTFLPAYILMLSEGSQFVVGLALSLQALGMMITPLVGANLIEHRKRVLPIGFLTGGAMRTTVLLIALSGFFLEGLTALVAVMICLLLFGLFQGMQGVIFNYLMSKVIPVSRRGRLTGLRNFLAGVTSAAVAWIGGHYLLGENPGASGYSWIFVLAFALTSVGLILLTGVREPEPPTVQRRQSLWDRLSDVPELLRNDRTFTRYFLARAVTSMGRVAMPFYVLYAGETLGLTGQLLGTVTFAFTMAGTLSNLFWGYLADRTGFRLVFLSSITLWAASTFVLVFSSSQLEILVVFVGIGAAIQGFENSSQNLTLEFGSREGLPIRIAIANTASEMAGMIGPLVGGLLAAYFGYVSVFVTSICFLVAGGAAAFFFVPEPRK